METVQEIIATLDTKLSVARHKHEQRIEAILNALLGFGWQTNSEQQRRVHMRHYRHLKLWEYFVDGRLVISHQEAHLNIPTDSCDVIGVHPGNVADHREVKSTADESTAGQEDYTCPDCGALGRGVHHRRASDGLPCMSAALGDLITNTYV